MPGPSDSSRATWSVFLSTAGAELMLAHPIARQISDCGATVFLDESWVSEGDVEAERRVLNALNVADEIVVFLSTTHGAILNPTPAVFARRFIWLTLGVASARGIPIRGLLAGSFVKRSDVIDNREVPDSIKQSELFERSNLDVYLDQLRQRIQKNNRPPSLVPAYGRPLHVLLYYDVQSPPIRNRIQKQLREEKAILSTFDRWPIAQGKRQRSSSRHRTPDSGFDAVAIFFGQRESPAWESAEIKTLLQPFINLNRPVVLVVPEDAKDVPQLPDRVQKGSIVYYSSSPLDSLLRVVWGLVGYHDYSLLPSSGDPGQSADIRQKVFVSYSHRDVVWLERLRVHLTPLENAGLIDIWDDTRIQAGEVWRDEIKRAIESAKVVVLLISADFLASNFIHKEELPRLLQKAKQ